MAQARAGAGGLRRAGSRGCPTAVAWLPVEDSNLAKRLQRPRCCRYTNGEWQRDRPATGGIVAGRRRFRPIARRPAASRFAGVGGYPEAMQLVPNDDDLPTEVAKVRRAPAQKPATRKRLSA